MKELKDLIYKLVGYTIGVLVAILLVVMDEITYWWYGGGK